MLEWFTEQDTTIKVAIIGACGTVLAAIIAGIFNLFNKKSKTKENATHMVNQTATSQNNTQIEVQNKYYEMTTEQACQTAINLFMQNFPKLENIARETAEKRASEFCKEAIQKIIKKGINDFSSFADPDVQYALYEAQKNYARFGTTEMLSTLTELIAKRINHDNDFVLKVAIDKALEIAPLLSQKQLNYLSLLFMCTKTKSSDIKTIQDLKSRLDLYVHLWGDADFDSRDYLNMLGCLQIGINNMVRYLANEYDLPQADVENICPEQIKKLSGDYTTSHIGTILAITNSEVNHGFKLDPKIWVT